ncbi:TadE/TadG family type IV pilus assembly protein [Brevundimonas sp. SORGH_AS_0993]|uniref:TadE/TadG family type IV pilus assembly protein n=1 Tax=Brevundimonas sp. SORGH_AS_0993 TaxID=3041794 RepID=UPI00277E253E|nr:TadE/TadG family type IV pilus assembly protein [Brevundimonas sp. SORGH_AS_0993]MDQ1154532.1 Flp pilus assembly protein TadG [Brevundimonas sp. SORGH_AS_0993]
MRGGRRREGAAAVEFAFVALPFFFMIFAMLELGLAFVVDSLLENAVVETSRLVRTGQASSQKFDQTKFKSAVCERMGVFNSDCRDRLTVDVRVIPQFTTPNPPNPIRDGEMDPKQVIYDGGQPGDLILVRAWYQQPLVTPLLSQAGSRLKNGALLLSAATAFRNEPWNV